MDKSQLDNGGDAALLVHSIRDHFYHTIPIMGAMWGAVGGVIRGYPYIELFVLAVSHDRTARELLDAFRHKRITFNEDQVFLSELVRWITLYHIF
jgi:hypothetical protein